MKLILIKSKEIELTEYAISIEWSGSVEQASRSLSFNLVNQLTDPNIKLPSISLGSKIKLYESGELLFYGIVTSIDKGNSDTLDYTARDFLFYLTQSTISRSFKNVTAELITESICNQLQIKSGKIKKTNTHLSKLIALDETPYNVIMKAYTLASKKTKKKYIIRMHGTSLNVLEKGEIVKNFELSEKINITSSSFSENMESMVNQVVIYNENGAVEGFIKNEEQIKKYGTIQKIYQKEEGVDSKSGARAVLNGVSKSLSIDSMESNLDCISGNGIKVHDTFTGKSGLFWISNDTHTWSNGTRTMSLELDFKNIWDKQEVNDE